MQIFEDQVLLETITADTVRTVLQETECLEYQWYNKNRLTIEERNLLVHGLESFRCIQVYYGEYSVDRDDGYVRWLSTNTQYFHPDQREQAIQCFLNRLNAKYPNQRDETGESLEHIRIRMTQKLHFDSHYQYLHAVLERFWRKVFHKTPSEMHCAGIIHAYGDKCYSHKQAWEAAGIPFQRGALLYLITHTSAVFPFPTRRTREWVIEQYPQYQAVLEQIEQEILREQFS